MTHSACKLLGRYFQKLNELKLSMHGRSETIVSSGNKIETSKKQNEMKKNSTQKNDSQNFPALSNMVNNGKLFAEVK